MVQKIALLTACVLATGCATGVVGREDLARMQPDCTNAGLQIKWLEHQIEHGGFDANRSDYEMRYLAQANELLWTVRSTCRVQSR